MDITKVYLKKISTGKGFLKGISVDCAIFGFDLHGLKILLVKPKYTKQEWALPGGYIMDHEDMDAAAVRTLKDRTGLDDIYLSQFHTFGSNNRNTLKYSKIMVKMFLGDLPKDHWYYQRFISVGYLSVVDYIKTVPTADDFSDACQWHDITDLPPLMMDHADIVSKALQALRDRVRQAPIGMNLLPDQFTMKDLQNLYEIILGEKMVRSNFQRSMLSSGILDRLEKQKGCSHKAPYLYRFNKKRYKDVMDQFRLNAQGNALPRKS